MLDMDMGTTSVDFQRGNDATFSSDCDFTMGGNWQLRLNVLADNRLHNATVKLFVPA
jgi:hypothetical protein